MENIYDQYLDEKKEEILSENADKLGKMSGLFAPIQDVMYASGLMSAGGKERAKGIYRSELEFGLEMMFEPLTADLATLQGTMDALFGGYWIRNRAGTVAGEWIGGGIGLVLGFLIGGPAGAIWGQQLLSWIGGFIGAFGQEFFQLGTYEHPEMEGLPWNPADQTPYVPPGHDPAWFTTPAPTVYGNYALVETQQNLRRHYI